MQYLGNKSKIADEILEVILKDAKPGQYYVEPFVGSAAVIQRVPNTFKRIGADKNPYLIALLTAVRDGWEPPNTVTEEEYNAIKKNMNAYPKELVAFVGFCCSFSGKFFGGYARDNKGTTNYADRGRSTLIKDRQHLQGIEFRTGTYISLDVPPDAVIYCDPPYEKTTGYAYKVNDFAEFWRWCDALVDKGHRVFVSGYSKPILWEVAWQKTVKTMVNNVNSNQKDDLGRLIKQDKDRTEKLFTRFPK